MPARALVICSRRQRDPRHAGVPNKRIFIIFSQWVLEWSCRGRPASGFSHVARNIRVAGAKRTPLVKGLLRDMQIARVALFEVNEKIRERCAATKGARTNAHHPGTARLYVVSGLWAGRQDFPITASFFSRLVARTKVVLRNQAGVGQAAFKIRIALLDQGVFWRSVFTSRRSRTQGSRGHFCGTLRTFVGLPPYRPKAASPLSAKQRLIGFGRFAPKPVLPGHEASFPKQTLARCAPFGPECRLGGGEQSK